MKVNQRARRQAHNEAAKAACRAIEARIKGVFDDPDLINWGPLTTDMARDVLSIAERANSLGGEGGA